MTKARDLKNLLNRAAAAVEDPDELTSAERAYLAEDLTIAAKHEVPQSVSGTTLKNKIENAGSLLQEVEEALSEMGWDGNKGLLYRVRRCLKRLKEVQ
jgi:hypothetical protein